MAVSIGISDATFWDMTPRDLRWYADGRAKLRKRNGDETDEAAWLTGVYMSRAIAACFDKRSKYPATPFGRSEQKEKTAKQMASEFAAYADALNKQKFPDYGGD